jgi:hypothetical protein
VRNVSQIGDRCVVVVRITIPCVEGSVFREATGTEDEELRDYGDPSSNAEGDGVEESCVEVRPGPEFLAEVSMAIY